MNRKILILPIASFSTAALERLRGEGGFEGDFGKGSAATLDYWFE